MRTWTRQTLARFAQPKYVWWLGGREEFMVWRKPASWGFGEAGPESYWEEVS